MKRELTPAEREAALRIAQDKLCNQIEGPEQSGVLDFAAAFLAELEKGAEPVAWETPVAGLIQYVTESKYQKFTDAIKRYYRPYIKPSQIPSDMVLVPREPTQDMLIAAWNTSRVGRCPEDDIATYRAMIAAAPKGE